MHYYKVTLRVSNEVGVLARITTLLRKFRINIRSLEVAPIDPEEKFSDIHMEIQSEHKEIKTAMLKTERLIPVISLDYKEI